MKSFLNLIAREFESASGKGSNLTLNISPDETRSWSFSQRLQVGHIWIEFKISILHFFWNIITNPLSANPGKWSSIPKQFVGCCRRIFWVYSRVPNKRSPSLFFQRFVFFLYSYLYVFFLKYTEERIPLKSYYWYKLQNRTAQISYFLNIFCSYGVGEE